MRSRLRAIGVLAAFFTLGAALAAHAQAPEKRAITFRDLIAMHRVSDPQISPGGKWVAYSVATPDYDANHLVKDIWIVAVAGGDSRQVTRDGTAERPRWSPDGARIAFLSSRDGAAQVYSMSVPGGDATKVTSRAWPGPLSSIWSERDLALALALLPRRKMPRPRIVHRPSRVVDRRQLAGELHLDHRAANRGDLAGGGGLQRYRICNGQLVLFPFSGREPCKNSFQEG